MLPLILLLSAWEPGLPEKEGVDNAMERMMSGKELSAAQA